MLGMDPDEARKRFVEHLDEHVESGVREAMLAVPRHEFVPETYRHFAYEDRPLPIGEGATISAPGLVAEMVDHLALEPGDRVLEIGTGSGYHAAVVAEVVGPEHVYSVEYDPALAEDARARLDGLGYGDVSIHVGDGREGWPEHAPFDAIYLTCAVRALPPALVEQLRSGGLVLAPLGIAAQRLTLVRKDDGELDRLDCGPVQFVPMQGPDVDGSGTSEGS